MSCVSFSRNFLLVRVQRLPLFAAALLLSLPATGMTADSAAHDANQTSTAEQQHRALDDDHLRTLVQWMMERIDAPQREQVGQLAHAAQGDLETLEQRAETARAPRADILLAATIDAKALEAARVEEMRVADERSRRVDRLLLDIASALTPAQRARLRAEMAH